MGVLAELREKLARQDEVVAVRRQRLIAKTLEEGFLPPAAWDQIDPLLGPAAELHMSGHRSNGLAVDEGKTIAGKPSGSKRGAI